MEATFNEFRLVNPFRYFRLSEVIPDSRMVQCFRRQTAMSLNQFHIGSIPTQQNFSQPEFHDPRMRTDTDNTSEDTLGPSILP